MLVSTYSGTRIDYLIVLLLLLVSGNNVIEESIYREIIQVTIFMVLFGGYVMLKRPPLTQGDVVVFTIFMAIIGMQGVLFSFFPLVTVAGVLIRFGIGFLAVRSVDDFPRVYVNVMTAICLVSLLFYIPEQIFAAAGKDFSRLFDSVISSVQNISGQCCDRHIVIYNFEFEEEVRANAGFFWESGAFAGYILLAVCFLGLAKEEYSQRGYYFRLLALMITLLTTASTAGYLSAPVALITHYRKSKIPITRQLGVIAVGIALLPIVLFGVTKVWQQDVLGGKISMQYDKAVTQSGNWQINRFGNLLYDWQYIRERPLLGWGIHEKTIWAKAPQDFYLASGMGNGLTGFLRSFGFLGLGTFLFFAGRGFYQLGGGRLLGAGAALGTVVLVLVGQQYLRFPLFMGLFFLANGRTTLLGRLKSSKRPSGNGIGLGGHELAAAKHHGQPRYSQGRPERKLQKASRHPNVSAIASHPGTAPPPSK